MGEIVEPLRRCTKGSVESNLDVGLRLSIWDKLSKTLRPVPIRLDVELYLTFETYRDGEWMPLEKAEFGNLEKDVLTRSILPKSFSWDIGSNLDRFVIEDTDRSR